MPRFGAWLVAIVIALAPLPAHASWQLALAVVGQLGEAVGNLADGIAKAVKTGLAIRDDVAVRALRAHIVELNDQIARLTAEQATLTARLRDHAGGRAAETWQDLHFQLDQLAPAIQELILSLDRLGPELVEVAGPQVVTDLRVVARSRASLVARLRGLPEPATDEDRTALGELLDRYDDLIVNLQRLNQALFDYARTFGSGTG
ncbi:MAG: hypothetical protein ACK4QW_12455 [Alphaproteobacteria bacterium]